jgi:hypothetical protein
MRKQVLAQPGTVTLKNQPKLDEIAERIRTRVKSALDGVIEIGRDLIAAKKIVGHGNWLPGASSIPWRVPSTKPSPLRTVRECQPTKRMPSPRPRALIALAAP